VQKEDRSRNPIFDVMLSVQNRDRPGRAEEQIQAGIESIAHDQEIHRVAKVDLTLEVLEEKETILFNLEYCSALFKKETMKSFIDSFREITVTVLDNKEIKLKDIKISHDLSQAKAKIYTTVDSEFEF
jgi:hypothetical protein